MEDLTATFEFTLFLFVFKGLRHLCKLTPDWPSRDCGVWEGVRGDVDIKGGEGVMWVG